MADREKVIAGLECCSRSKLMDKCNECPYFSSCGTEGGSFAEIAHDALALLKAQEPRVMTAEQLEDWLEPVYLEDIFSGARWALIADFSANWFTFKVTEPGFLKEEEFHATEYGRRWRCWNKKPTKEQSEAVKWE